VAQLRAEVAEHLGYSLGLLLGGLVGKLVPSGRLARGGVASLGRLLLRSQGLRSRHLLVTLGGGVLGGGGVRAEPTVELLEPSL
jgi:hypothetical protein